MRENEQKPEPEPCKEKR